MKIRKLITIVLVGIILTIGVIAIVLYKIGDTVFDEVIENQIIEMETITDSSEIKSEPEETAQVPVTTAKQTNNIPTQVTPSIVNTDNQPQIVHQPQNNVNSATEITKENLQDIKEEVTATDKMYAAKLVLSKLNQSDINELTRLSAGGITQEEKQAMKAIVYQRFTAEEIQQIREMYIKYMK